jgi:ParB/RepB/Spo0J family partition protein
MGDLVHVNIDQVRANKVALRQVDRTSEEYLGLVDSIKIRGFSGVITARKKVDEETKQSYYEVIDGLHRWTACKDAGVQVIGLDVQELTDDEVLVAQILQNAHKIETKPAEYAQQMKRMMGINQMLTEAELAAMLGKSPAWIQEMLKLNNILDEKIKDLINTGKIPLMSAYALAKLPPEEQANYVDKAITMKPREFCPIANDRAKAIKDANRKGQKVGEASFEPRSHARKLKELQAAEVDRAFLKRLLDSNGITNPVDAAVLVLQWTQHLDPASKQEQLNGHEKSVEARKKVAEDKKNERASQKKADDERKAEEAAKEAADARDRARQQALTGK